MTVNSQAWIIASMALGGLPPVLLAGWRMFLEVKLQTESAKSIRTVEAKAIQDPTVAGYAWDVARRKLEAYFDRNLSQVNSIFWVSVIAMGVGFGFILGGIVYAFRAPSPSIISNVPIVSGVISEFISLTFMLIYRSTLKQASTFMSVLERINSVGMAVQILDAIGNEEANLKNKTRAELVHLLLMHNNGSSSAMAKQAPKE